MNRIDLVLASLGALMVTGGSLLISRQALPARDWALENGGCRSPVTSLEPRSGDVRDAAVILHGLSANRRLMMGFGSRLAAAGLRVYLLDLPGHGDSTEAYSFARAEECSTAALELLTRRGEIHADRTVLVGHSLGGAIAVRMADRFPVAATIALSPAPLVLPRRMPGNLLVFSAQFDLPMLKRAAHSLEQAAGGERRAAADFVQQRAFELVRVAGATHTGLLYDPAVAARTAHWAGRALPGGLTVADKNPPGTLGGAVIGFVGLLLLFPFAADALQSISRAGRTMPVAVASPGRPRASLVLLHWGIAALFSVAVLHFVMPLRFLHMRTGDYLASLLLLTGILVTGLGWEAAKASLRFNARSLGMAIPLGFFTILATGAWLNWQMTDAWLNGPRWLRFAVLLPVCWVHSFAEEVSLGPARRRFGDVGRFSLYLAMRLQLWLACLLAIFAFSSGEILLLLLTVYLAAFSVAQRLGADAVRRRTGSPTAVAAFGAILAAWFIAALFPLG